MTKKYEKYKSSGVEWLGDIPEHWKVRKLRFLVSIKTGGKNTIDQQLEGKYPFFVRSKKIERINSYSYDGEAILTAGDGDIGKVFHYINEKFDYHQRVYKFSDFKNIMGKFFFYYIESNFYKEVLKFSAKSTVDSLRMPMIKNFIFSFPDIEEQQKIVAYLDEKSEAIDQLIKNKESLINLLEEEKKATITKSLTKGINKTVKFKDSSVDWLGEIPEHWEVRKLRYLGTLQNGVSAGAEYFGSGFPFVSYSDVYNNAVLPDEIVNLSKSTKEDRIRFSVKEGDIFFTRTSETIEEIGFSSVCNRTIDNANFSGFLIRFRPSNNIIHKGYSKYYFRSNLHRLYFVREMNIIIRASLSQDLLKNLIVILPSMKEQEEIAGYLDKETQKIDDLKAKYRQEIDLIKEYKERLIYDVVTGKINVLEH